MKAMLTICMTLLISTEAFAAGLRCNTRIVNVGDSIDEVINKCGEPDSTYNKSIAYRQSAYRIGPLEDSITEQVYVDVWVYRMTTGQFSRSLVFAGGELIDIELGERN